MTHNLEASLRFYDKVALGRDLQGDITDLANWDADPDFVRGRSVYRVLENRLNNPQKSLPGIVAVQVKNVGDFRDPKNPGLPGDGDYAQIESAPLIFPVVNENLTLTPKCAFPIPRGGEVEKDNWREFEDMVLEFEAGSNVIVPLGAGTYNGRKWNGQPLGVLAVGLYHRRDPRFYDFFKYNLDNVRHGDKSDLTRLMTDYARELVGNSPTVQGWSECARKGFYEWGVTLSRLRKILHVNPNSANAYFDGSEVFMHDFGRVLRRSELSPEQAYLTQVIRVAAPAIASIQSILCKDFGNSICMAEGKKEIGFNAFKEFLNGYFEDVAGKIREQIDSVSEILQGNTRINVELIIQCRQQDTITRFIKTTHTATF